MSEANETEAVSPLTLLAVTDEELSRARTAARQFPEEICVKYGARRLRLLVYSSARFKEPWTEGIQDRLLSRFPARAAS